MNSPLLTAPLVPTLLRLAVPNMLAMLATALAAIAESAPQSLGDLQGISGLGVKKLEAYGEQVLRVCKGS